jgi:hypothetical protein
MFSRQAGKNEMSACLEAYLLMLFQRVGGQIVKGAPTGDQADISRERLLRYRGRRWMWAMRPGDDVVRFGNASVEFLSANPEANVVGHTASLLLECDEAQDVDEAKWVKSFLPMAASTAATTVYYGTAWLKSDLLGRMRRVVGCRPFIVPWSDVAAEVPAYRRYVEGQRAVLGADHPLFLSQYELREVDAQVGMIPADVRLLMRGQHPRLECPSSGERYYMTIDIGGEATEGQNVAAHDATVATVFRRRWTSAGNVWEVVHRHVAVGVKAEAVSLRMMEIWHPVQVVVDATGIGAGVASQVAVVYREAVLPFVFGPASKSQLGWDFIGLCRQGRFVDHVLDGSSEQAMFWSQVGKAQLEVRPGPGRLCSWGVPACEGHDDVLVSAALVAELERVVVSPYQESGRVEAVDVLAEMDRGGF